MHKVLNGKQDGLAVAAPEPRDYTTTLVAIVLTGLVARLALLIHGAPFYDDAFITFRFAANLANGNGLFWIPGEKMLETSTPLYACVLAFLGKLFGTIHIPYLAIALGLLSYVGACVLLQRIARGIGFNAIETSLLYLLFCFQPNIVLASVDGMETGFLLFLMLLAVHLWIQGSEGLAGIGCALLIATRVDAIAWVGTLFLAFIIAKRALPWRAIVAFSTGVAIWIAVAIYAWGGFIPLTTRVKPLAFPVRGSFVVRLFSVLDAYFRFGNRMALIVIVLPFAVGAWVAYKRRSIAGGAIVFYILGSAVALAAARAPIFPWYIVPVNLAMIFVEILGWGWLLSKVRIPHIAALLVFFLLLGVWLVRDYYDSWRVLQAPANLQVGLWLQRHARPDSTVFTEPAGWIGYYCNCRLRDSTGIVNPEMVHYWSRLGGRERWFSTALRESVPDYVVLRQHEYTTGILFSSEHAPLFATESDKQWFQESYRMVFIADSPVPTQTQDTFFIFQRK
jgi:hypothetical protein